MRILEPNLSLAFAVGGLLLALVAANPACAQETLPPGYTYIPSGAVPLSTPGIALTGDGISNRQANEIRILDGQLLEAGEQSGTIVSLAPYLSVDSGSAITWRRGDNVSELLPQSSPEDDDRFRMLLIVPGAEFGEQVFASDTPGDDRLSVFFRDGDRLDGLVALGCFRFVLPTTGYNFYPIREICDDVEPRPLIPGERDTGSYWLLASDPDGSVTPVLVVQQTDASINFESRITEIDPRPAPEQLAPEVTWVWLRFPGIEGEVDRILVAVDDGPPEVLPLVDRASLYEVDPPQGRWALGAGDWLLHMGAGQASDAEITVEMADTRYACESIRVSPADLAGDLEAARIATRVVICGFHGLEFTIAHDERYAMSASVDDDRALEVRLGSCVATGVAAGVPRTGQAFSCVSGLALGEVVNISATPNHEEIEGFVISQTTVEVTQELLSSAYQFDPEVVPENRFLVLRIQGNHSTSSLMHIFTFYNSVNANVRAIDADASHLLLELQFEPEAMSSWAPTGSLNLGIAPSVDGLELLDVDGAERNADSLEFTLDLRSLSRSRPPEGASLADYASQSVPPISLISNELRLPETFTLTLQIPNPDGDTLPNRICDVGMRGAAIRSLGLNGTPPLIR